MHAGFVGLGSLGTQLAEGLVNTPSMSVALFDVNPSALEPFAGSGATLAESLAEVASAADVVGVCVQSEAQLREVVAGPDGLLAAPMAEGATIAIHSTVHPDTCRELAKEAACLGVALIDAAISNGGRIPGATPSRVVLVGGDAATFDRHRAYFESFGDLVEHTGPLGSGQVVKLINNLLLVVNMAMASDAIRCAERLGAPRDVIVRSLASGSGSSQGMRTLRALGPDGQPRPRSRIAHTFDLLEKDVALALDVLGNADGQVQTLIESGRAGLDAFRSYHGLDA